MTELDLLEQTACQLYDQMAAASDEKTKAELRAAADALNDTIDLRYEAGERYAHQSASKSEKGTDPDADKARREGRNAVKGVLRRVCAIGGQAAVDYALTLMDQGLTHEQAEEAASVKMPQGSLLHRPRTAAPAPAPRAATPEAESAWLREARLAAETQWARAFGLPVPQPDRRSAEQIALHESFGELAARAAGVVRDPDDGRKIYRHDRIDEVDVDLYQRGAAAARKLWPGI